MFSPNRLWALMSILLVLSGLPALAATDTETTCQKTSERVLEPYLKSVSRVLDAQKFHAEATTKRAGDIRKFIADLKATRPAFDEHQQ